MIIDLYINTLIPALAALFFLLWLVSIVLRDVSFIDSFWAFSFVFIAWVAAYSVKPSSLVAYLSLTLVTLWGLRLGIHLLLRWKREGADKRYVRIIGDRQGAARHLFTLWFVFLLQGVLILLISSPVITAITAQEEALSFVNYAGLIVFTVGFLFEAIGDRQLKQFKEDPNNKGKVLDSGLWRYTRHPNYFGDFCIWWGLWLVFPMLGTVYAPLLMAFLLIFWSGKPLLEKGLKKNRPDYEIYCQTTSGFFPRPPKSTKI